jgi:hypothetical protein
MRLTIKEDTMKVQDLVTLLPTIIAAEALLASVFYALNKAWGSAPWGSALYWLSACVITVAVTMIPRWG